MVTVATIDFPVIPVIVFVINQTRTINIHNKLIPAKNTIIAAINVTADAVNAISAFSKVILGK